MTDLPLALPLAARLAEIDVVVDAGPGVATFQSKDFEGYPQGNVTHVVGPFATYADYHTWRRAELQREIDGSVDHSRQYIGWALMETP
jgi:hypothetical protein